MFYIQFFMRNPFLLEKKEKKNVGGSKTPKFGKKSDFVHISAHFVQISALFLQSTRLSQQWALQEGYMTCSLTFLSSKTAKNSQKRPKMAKTAKTGKKWPKTVKNAIFFLHFLLPIFFLLCRHFICCSLNQLEMAQNGQKWPKTVKNGIFDRFWGRKKSTPPG